MLPTFEVGKYDFLILWVKKPKNNSRGFFCKAEILTNDHLIIRLETIYKAEGWTLATNVKTFELCKFCVYAHFDLIYWFYYILKVVLCCFEGWGSCQSVLNWGGAACQVTFPFCDMLSYIYSYIDVNTHRHKNVSCYTMICQENLILLLCILIDTGDFRTPPLSLKAKLLCFWWSFWKPSFLISMPWKWNGILCFSF